MGWKARGAEAPLPPCRRCGRDRSEGVVRIARIARTSRTRVVAPGAHDGQAERSAYAPQVCLVGGLAFATSRPESRPTLEQRPRPYRVPENWRLAMPRHGSSSRLDQARLRCAEPGGRGRPQPVAPPDNPTKRQCPFRDNKFGIQLPRMDRRRRGPHLLLVVRFPFAQ